MRGAIYWTDLKTKERAEKMLNQIITNYELSNIKMTQTIHQRTKTSIYYENGDMWQCLTPRGDLRGVKVNLAYIPYGTYGHPLEIAISTAVALPYNGIIYY